ncbi:MAG: hypothetical protein J0J01_26430 [Reyranella sp.]|uniref:hypothetical protein n=1 Tax=Reyranella sp. TaxID=1929291 RepID=UPI001AD0F1D4|nr:hypothetical protein [Reyranella sp.]MBN9090464.1 hypothetical protein [Reyranella sp.]
MRKLLPFGLALALAIPAFAQTPPDGQWRGRSDGGQCNAPLDFDLTIDSGIVDGSAFDTTAHGPVPNPRKTAPPPPTPSLWQIHGLAKPGTFSLLAVASVKATDRREGRLTASLQGNTLVVTESSGCGRTARLTKG